MASMMQDGRKFQWIRDTARRIVSGSRTTAEESRRVWEWTRQNLRYREDPPGMEWVQSLEASMQIKAGDCDDMAVAAGTLLASLGHEVVPVAVWWENRPRFTHAVMLDKTSNLIVDPVSPIFAPWPPQGRKIHALMEG